MLLGSRTRYYIPEGAAASIENCKPRRPWLQVWLAAQPSHRAHANLSSFNPIEKTPLAGHSQSHFARNPGGAIPPFARPEVPRPANEHVHDWCADSLCTLLEILATRLTNLQTLLDVHGAASRGMTVMSAKVKATTAAKACRSKKSCEGRAPAFVCTDVHSLSSRLP